MSGEEPTMPPREKAPTDSDPAAMSPDELEAATEQAAVEAGTAVRLAVVAGPSTADSLVVGDGDTALEITAAGTLVPADQEQEVRDAAKRHGVTIRKVT